MAYNNGMIEKPIGIVDLQHCLGTDSCDVGTLCTHQNINKWAKYKPERRAGQTNVTYATRKANKFGFDVPYCTNAIMNGKVHDILEEEDAGWGYLKPRGDRTAYTGGVKEFYRLTDFCRNDSDSGDASPSTLKGYNHNAKIPFVTELDMNGISEKYDSDGLYYEINKQVTNTLTLTFKNNEGGDLRMQDFVDLDTIVSGRSWRPILQAFSNYKPAGGTDWYDRGSVRLANGDIETAGAVITQNDDSFVATLNLNAAPFTTSPYSETFFHLCAGIGLSNNDMSSVSDVFVMPYTDEQLEDEKAPFYYRFKLVSYMARTLQVTAMQWHDSGRVQWVVATGTAPYFKEGVNADQQVRITMTISKLQGQKLDFISQFDTPTYGYDQLKIQARETLSGATQETIFYLQPTSSSWQSQSHTYIEEGPTTETVTLYATFNTSNIPLNTTAAYHLYANTGGSEWDNIGFMSIKKVQ